MHTNCCACDCTINTIHLLSPSACTYHGWAKLLGENLACETIESFGDTGFFSTTEIIPTLWLCPYIPATLANMRAPGITLLSPPRRWAS